MRKLLLALPLLGSLVAGGVASAHEGRWYGDDARPTVEVRDHRLDPPPPVDRFEHVRERRGYVWVAGHYRRDDGRRFWVRGHYERVRHRRG